MLRAAAGMAGQLAGLAYNLVAVDCAAHDTAIYWLKYMACGQPGQPKALTK